MISVVILVAASVTSCVVARPAGLASQEIVDYLTNFGYLKFSETQSLISEGQVRDAIRNLQFFAGLEVTGDLDSNTTKLLTKPRCGVPDVSHPGFTNRRRRKRYSLQGQRWSKTSLTWSLNLGPTLRSRGLSNAVLRRELSQALDMWSRETTLSFTEISPNDPYNQADIRIYFYRGLHDDGYPFDGSGSVLAHAFFPGSGRGGDVHFDDDERWSDQRVINRDVTSVFAVAVHEFGHSLGLSHSSVEGSLMYPWYSGIPKDQKLPVDDLEAVRYLYGDPVYGLSPDSQFPETNEIDGHLPNKNSDENQNGGDKSKDADEENDDDKNHYPEVPDKCETDFDAVAVIRSEMWVFKGRYFWRIDRHGGSRDDPVELSAFWYGLPNDISKVDAVYERKDHKIMFFVGRHFFILNGNSELQKGPVPITTLGLPETLERIDGAMRWGWNDKTYLFADTMYWRFDEDIGHVELDYPRDISIWGGVPYNIDAVFQHTDKKTYFFKGRYFWEFDDLRMQVKDRNPTPISEHWMHCPKEIKDPFKGTRAVSSGSSPTVVSSNQIQKLMSGLLLIVLAKAATTVKTI